MDIAGQMHRKAAFIEQQKVAPMVRQLQTILQKRLMEDCDIRTFSPALIRALIFDLTYLMLRHRAWHLAPLFSELTIDFINSEYALPHQMCVVIVEGMHDLLHHYMAPEIDWTADRYDEEFLEHLLVSTLMAAHEGELLIDLGFGRNLIELLQDAMQLASGSNNPDAFQFAPEVTGRLHKIMERMLSEAEANPASLDRYKLKNFLQRDPLTRKHTLQVALLERLMMILNTCGYLGSSLAAIETKLGSAVLSTELSLLQRTGLLFEETQRRPLPLLYRLSREAYTLTSQTFAEGTLAAGKATIELAALPAPYQAALLQLAWHRDPEHLSALIAADAAALKPEALKIVIEAWRKNQLEESLLELFQNLLHNRAHAWIRAEICQALPFRSFQKDTQILLESLAEYDPSPMVRSAARSALKRQQKAVPSGETCPSV